VTRMASAARAITAVDLGQRLPAPGTSDALEDLGKAFNDLLSRLQEAFERQRRFTGDASHQLRTPLAVMLGQVEVALRRDRPPQEYKRVLQIVSEQAGRLQRIVEMLLFLARADAEAASPARTTLSVGPWLQDQLRNWATHPRASDIRLVLSEADRLLTHVHEPLLGQVVDILLDNACKYSRPGTPITVSVRGDEAHVELVVEDQGCGIDPSDLPHVFDPFYRSPRLREMCVGGVGLGLAIARRVTSALGGAIAVHSEPGRGSRFVVRLAA
jgi:signal transduction histidine kinase